MTHVIFRYHGSHNKVERMCKSRQTFTQLGSVIHSSTGCDPEVNRRSGPAWSDELAGRTCVAMMTLVQEDESSSFCALVLPSCAHAKYSTLLGRRRWPNKMGRRCPSVRCYYLLFHLLTYHLVDWFKLFSDDTRHWSAFLDFRLGA